MTDEKYIELMHKEIDGLITAKERARLRAYLEQNREAKNLYDELVRTNDLLDKVPEIEPSPGLKKRIMNSIELKPYPAKQGRSAVKSLFLNLLATQKPRLAYAFALGAVFGFFIFALFSTKLNQKYRSHISDYYGTIGFNENASFKIVEKIPINQPEITGEIILKKSNNTVGVKLDLNTSSELETVFGYDETLIHLGHFDPISGTKIFLKTEENHTRLSTSGNIQCVLFFSKTVAGPTWLDLKLVLSGNECYRRQIMIK